MRTSGLLPEECREEIRARKKNWEIHLTGVLAHVNIDPQPEDIFNLKRAEQVVHELAWVLGDDDS